MPLIVHHNRHQQYSSINPEEHIEQQQQQHQRITCPFILSPLYGGYLNNNYNVSNCILNNTQSNVSINHQYISNQTLFANISNHSILTRRGHRGTKINCNIL